MEHVGHQLLEAHVLNAGDAFGTGEVARRGVATLLALARVVDQELGDFAERPAFLARVRDQTDTSPTDLIGPYLPWGDANSIVSIDPWGASVADVFAAHIAQGYDIRPTIAVTKAHIHLPEVRQAVAFQRLQADGRVLLDDGSAVVTKVAIEPVWWLPGVARRFKVSEAELRRAL